LHGERVSAVTKLFHLYFDFFRLGSDAFAALAMPGNPTCAARMIRQQRKHACEEARELPLMNYIFRLSIQVARLLKLP
jgi:hypothetical protein